MAASKLDAVYPLALRSTLAVVFGVWGWGTNILGLRMAGVDLPSLIQGRGLPNKPSSENLYSQVFVLAAHLTFVLNVGSSIWMVFDPSTAWINNWMLMATAAVTIIYLFNPRAKKSEGRQLFIRVARRVAIGDIDIENRLPYILLGDALTSYSRVLADFVVSIGTAVKGHTPLEAPDRGIGQPLVIPLVSAYPYLVRFKQCYKDYRVTGQKQHFYNMVKYATSIPMIVLAAMLKCNFEAISTETLFQFWIVAAFINSTYGFFWDVTFDWNLSLFFPNIKTGILRPSLSFKYPAVYYLAVVQDFFLRYTWAVKLTSHAQFADSERGLFILALVEVYRRWVWVFFRVEGEWSSISPELQKKIFGLPLHEDRAD
ncbi:protein Erd1p [Trichomonascus vanleenenianus]|uniref:Erd1p n=1 Tax=Trichomonascus vanleenenianus TaxID=2268995 RepID=UPI003ECA7E5D